MTEQALHTDVLEAQVCIEADDSQVVCHNLTFYWDRSALISGMMFWGKPLGHEGEAEYQRNWKQQGINEYHDDRENGSLTIELTGPEYAGTIIAWAAETLRATYAQRAQTQELLVRPVRRAEPMPLSDIERDELESRWRELEKKRKAQIS